MALNAMSITSRSFIRSTIALLLVGFLALTGIVAMTFWLGERAQAGTDDEEYGTWAC